MKNNEMTLENLEEMLRTFRIPYLEWGKGNSKTLVHLLKEIKERETTIQEEEGKLVRSVSVSYVDVFYQNENGMTYKLLENRQEFRDGRVRRRPYLIGSIAEKMKSGEDSQEAAYRALSEELGINERYILHNKRVREIEEDSPSYPGLSSRFKNYLSEVTLPRKNVRLEGYVEEQRDKNTFWIWKPINEKNEKYRR